MEELASFDAPRPVKLTVDDFAVLHRAGALAGIRRAELIEGMITETSPIRSRHAIVADELYFRLRLALTALGSPLRVVSAATVALPPHSAPEPDLVVTHVSGNDFYVQGRDLALVVEVSFATLRYDLTVKRDLYARAGIPECWVVDGEANAITLFWEPTDGCYARFRTQPVAGDLRSETIPDLAIDATGI